MPEEILRGVGCDRQRFLLKYHTHLTPRGTVIIGNTFTYTVKFIEKEGLQWVGKDSHTLTGDIAPESKGGLRPAKQPLSVGYSACFYPKASVG